MTKRKAGGRRKQSKKTMLDPHAQMMAQYVARHGSLMQELDAFESPLEELDRRIDAELLVLRNELSPHRPERVVELARLSCLPWGVAGQIKSDVEGGVTKAELLALLAQVLSAGEEDGSSIDEEPNGLYEAAHQWADSVGRLIEFAQMRGFIEARSNGVAALEFIAFLARTASVWIRSSSYPDMVEATYEALFGHQQVKKALATHLGFDAVDAVKVLMQLHRLQMEAANSRWGAWCHTNLAAYEEAQRSGKDPDKDIRDRIRAAHNRAWQPTADIVAIAPIEIATSLGLDTATVEKVLQHFTVDTREVNARNILDAFVGGDSPLRTNPVIATDRGTFMLVHDALVPPAVRESMEQALKAMPEWEQYQKWRGTLLEDLGKTALESMLPGATFYTSFEYFVPANEGEVEGVPDKYTKKVEGDILLLIDDVAIIVEAKAIAITPAARSGQTRGLHRDLSGIITKASEQAYRLQKRIEDDGGVRTRASGWLDLAHVREIHTVALSLEDLPGVATATSDLIAAELLDVQQVPWIVSIHDLQVIARLVERPAEFLLYLRRRRDPEVSLAYAASDELDLFLYFYEAGLYVSPDPEVTATELPYLTVPRTRDVRRRKRQSRQIISSRTDSLDAWHYGELDPDLPSVEKPALTGCPMIPLVDELQFRGSFGWLSAGATLLSADTKSQAGMVKIPVNLLASPDPNGRERSVAVLIGSRLSESWLLVWMTKPAQRSLANAVSHAKYYLRAKKYQLKLERGVVFLFDEETKALIDSIYDGALPIPDPDMDAAVAKLWPLGKFSSPPPPRRKPPNRGKKKKRKRK